MDYDEVTELNSFPMTAPPAKMLYFGTTYLYRVYSTEPGHEAVKALLSSTDSLASAPLFGLRGVNVIP